MLGTIPSPSTSMAGAKPAPFNLAVQFEYGDLTTSMLRQPAIQLKHPCLQSSTITNISFVVYIHHSQRCKEIPSLFSGKIWLSVLPWPQIHASFEALSHFSQLSSATLYSAKYLMSQRWNQLWRLTPPFMRLILVLPP